MVRRLTKYDARAVVELYHLGMGADAIAERLHCGTCAVREVLRGKTHTDITGGRICHGKRPKSQLARYNARLRVRAEAVAKSLIGSAPE